MSNKNHSGDSAQLSLFDILGLAGNIDRKYSSDEIEEIMRISACYAGNKRKENEVFDSEKNYNKKIRRN